MKNRLVVLAVLAAVVGLGLRASATDRDAQMIDWLAMDVMSFSDADGFGGSVWGETTFATPRRDWALLFGGGVGQLSPDASELPDLNYWRVGVGLKYYFMPLTSLSAVGDYTRFDDEGDSDMKSGMAILKQRLVRAEAPVAPYVTGGIGAREREVMTGSDDSVSETLLSVGGGIEFNMSEEFVIALDISYITADDTPDEAAELDGVVGQLQLKYYWF